MREATANGGVSSVTVGRIDFGNDVLNDCYRLGTACYLGYGLTPSFFDSLAAHHPLEAAKHFAGRALVVHGTSDEEIPVSDCSLYFDAFGSSAQTCRAEVLREADHTYSSGDSSEKLRRLTLDWLNQVHHFKAAAGLS
ncbi:prolyl oligopeptidase family serine peptidase [Alicyclobacillus fastidiosus]|uniref:Prolyl oligopeptidase family serine peptidase n=1 Tax=Alicyclobacillus fastidiosus TaxID=392011 RepID=A0ABY6ZKE6_9BACL|nr:prolyl oligopeptidase family serine peptidase [Alicyclobacillus fastidiosus]WAH43408.1 prolyl oligopeptidase family serine peptidase [Alicyclobacillus fastidiosus]GMA65480.1 hypothetical protein GCM10025859_59200 [Alicyclobacillus fastidiosus]